MSSYITPDNGRLVIRSDRDLDLSNISSDDAALHLLGGQYLEGNLYVGGTLVVNGDVVTLGNAGGSLTFNANISSDIIPSANETYDIGTEFEKWNSIYVKNTKTKKIQISTNPEIVTATVDISASINHIDSATTNAVSLADGYPGQLMTLVAIQTPTLPVTVTPDNALGYSGIVFTNVGDSATLVFTDGKWAVAALFRASAT